jgi:hypothetical protein
MSDPQADLPPSSRFLVFFRFFLRNRRAIAHRILIPAFGPLSIRNMFEGMVDIATQLMEKASRCRC